MHINWTNATPLHIRMIMIGKVKLVGIQHFIARVWGVNCIYADD